MEIENSPEPNENKWPIMWVAIGGAALFGLIGWKSGFWPHLLVFNIGMALISLLRLVPEKASRLLLPIGLGGILSFLLLVAVGFFANPSNDAIDTEDRTDWEPPPKEEFTPQEQIALEWSSHDQNAYWPVARLMLELCDIAYLPPSQARSKIRELGWESESINAGSMQGYVIDAGGDSIVTFRGTEAHEYDILQDLRFIEVKTEHGRMHGGFAKGYDSMHEQVIELLKRYETKRVWLTGHSLGGGLAVVCSYRLIEQTDYPIAGMMTFGQPKVVRESLADYLGSKLSGRYVFFVNDMDPVTRVINPYKHFGHMVRWNGSDIERSRVLFKSGVPGTPLTGQEAGYIEDLTDEELQELISQTEKASEERLDEGGDRVVQGHIPSIFDHYLNAYRRMLEALRTHKSQ